MLVNKNLNMSIVNFVVNFIGLNSRMVNGQMFSVNKFLFFRNEVIRFEY